jgi:hypothetical protein
MLPATRTRANLPIASSSQVDRMRYQVRGFLRGQLARVLYSCGLAGAIWAMPAAAAESGPISPPAPDSEAVFVGYFNYHSALAAEVERRREKGDETGEVLLDNVCGTIGIEKSSFWLLTPVIRDALAKLAIGNATGAGASGKPRPEQRPARAPTSRSDVAATAVQEIRRLLAPVEWDHLRSYLNDSFRMRIRSQIVRSK